MAVKDYLRPLTQRAIGLDAAPKKRNFITVHTSIHTDLHEYIKADATKHGISMSSMLEFVIANYYKDQLKQRDTVVSELGDPDYD